MCGVSHFGGVWDAQEALDLAQASHHRSVKNHTCVVSGVRKTLRKPCASQTPQMCDAPHMCGVHTCAVRRVRFPHSYQLLSMPCALLAHLFIFIAVVTAMHPISCTLPSPTAPSVLTERHVLKSKSKHYDCKERASTKVWKLIVSRGDICSGSGLQQNTATRY